MKNVKSTTVSMLIVAALGTACSDKGDPKTPAPTVESTDTIPIALVLSLSGADQGVGAEAQRGAQVAVAQINALGGVNGKLLSLRIVDDASTPATTVAKIRELAEKEKVVFGVGPSTSRAAKEMLPLVKANQVLYISPSATSSDLDCVDAATPEACAEYKSNFKWEKGTVPPPVLFKTAAPDTMLATALAQFASQSAPGTLLKRCNSIVIVRQGDSYGTPIAEVLRQRYVALSLAVKGPINLDPDIDKGSILRDAATQVANANVDCQVVIALPAVAAAYMRNWKDVSATATVKPGFITIGSDGFRQDQFLVLGRDRPNDENSETAGEGAFAVAADTAPKSSDGYPSFIQNFEAAYPNIAPGRYSSTAYDAVVLLAGAFAKANTTTDVPAVRKAIYEMLSGRQTQGPRDMTAFLAASRANVDLDYEGASGTLDFDDRTGNVPNNFIVWQVENKKFVERFTFDASELDFLR